MPTVTSRVPALIDYLVNLFTNAATLGQAAAPNTVTVYDGMPVTDLDPFLKLYVGLADPEAAGGQPAADFTQEWGAIGRLARNEMVTIHFCAEAWSGADDMKAVRLQVTGIVAAVEVLMQSDTTQFGGNALFPDPGVATGTLLQHNDTGKGPIAQIPFDITFKSRIGG